MSKLILLTLAFLAIVKVVRVSVDVSDLEGEWQTTYFWNYTKSKIVARHCETQNGIIWTISGDKWDQNTEKADRNGDFMFNSNGKWTIKEVAKTDNINFVKVEVKKDSYGLLSGLLGGLLGGLLAGLLDSSNSATVCFAYMRNEDTLFTMLNYTDPAYCPQKFIYFADVCSDTISYTVSTCKSGKCATSTDAN